MTTPTHGNHRIEGAGQLEGLTLVSRDPQVQKHNVAFLST